jgi:predicted transcriptional regulator
MIYNRLIVIILGGLMDIYEIKKAEVKFISLVKKGANNKSFFAKSKDGAGYILNARVMKSLSSTSENKHVLKCVVYEPDVVDLQGDWMTAESIKNYAYDFMKNYRNIDTEHDFEAGIGDAVESYIAPVDMVVNGESIKKGSHCIGIEVSDEIKKMVDDGEITGVSIAGSCERVMVEKSDKPKTDNIVLKAIRELTDLFKANKIDNNKIDNNKADDDKDAENNDNDNNNEEEEKEMDEMKKMFEDFKTEIVKSIKEQVDTSIAENAVVVDAKFVEIEKSITESKVADGKLEKSDKEKTEEKIAVMVTELAELRKSIEAPLAGNADQTPAEEYSVVYKTV